MILYTIVTFVIYVVQLYENFFDSLKRQYFNESIVYYAEYDINNDIYRTIIDVDHWYCILLYVFCAYFLGFEIFTLVSTDGIQQPLSHTILILSCIRDCQQESYILDSEGFSRFKNDDYFYIQECFVYAMVNDTIDITKLMERFKHSFEMSAVVTTTSYVRIFGHFIRNKYLLRTENPTITFAMNDTFEEETI